MLDGAAVPPPGDYPCPPMSTGEQIFFCIATVWMAVTLLALLLPRPWFVALFKIAYPFMPDKLE